VPADPQLTRWLAGDDAPEADWAPHVARLGMRGGLGRVGQFLLDLPALGQRWACASETCAPGRRAARHRSCCADLDVGPSPEEIARIEGGIGEIAAAMAGDPRWEDGVPAWHADGVFTRPGRRCVFARLEPGGLACGLHRAEDAADRPRGSYKPLPCRLFPLALVDLGERRLVTAVHRNTARLLDSRGATQFPCLGAGGAVLARVEIGTLGALLGPATAERVARAAERWAGIAGDPPAEALP
jgi:hypothetical protein